MGRQRVKKELPAIPPELDTPEFRKAWADWYQHRKEIRHIQTVLAVRLQLKRLRKLGLVRAIAAIEWSIMQGYRGIWEPPVDRTRRPSQVNMNGAMTREERRADEIATMRKAAFAKRKGLDKMSDAELWRRHVAGEF